MAEQPLDPRFLDTGMEAKPLYGAANPDEDPDESNISQMKGFEAALDTFLAQCSADSKCAFHNDGDAEGAFDEVMAKLDENPLPALKGRPELTLGAALSGVIEAMYSDASWPTLAKALRAAQQGNGSTTSTTNAARTAPTTTRSRRSR